MATRLNTTNTWETLHSRRDARESSGEFCWSAGRFKSLTFLLTHRLREIQRLGRFRTHLGLPLLREADLIGILLVSRDTLQPFNDQHVELLTTFADQAVIAIENTRLFEAEQQRTRELAESPLLLMEGTPNLSKVPPRGLGSPSATSFRSLPLP
jgi:GAF domain